MLITRWSLSCVNLQIELGRYKDLERKDRLCPFCDLLEDEAHAIYDCCAYDSIRLDYMNLLQENATVKEFLNPRDLHMLITVGNFLKFIEEKRNLLLRKKT